jgi:RNA polymerase subunit RPABC4/transcription elongation factor Spt4
VTLHRGRGCPNCNDTGYRGRTGIFEVLAVDENVRGLILQGANDTQIRQAAIDGGMHTIGEDGLRKVLDGITTLDEVSRVIYLAVEGGKVCPSCKDVLSQEFEFCPSCGDFVGEHCRSCRRRMSAVWAFCPHCGVQASQDVRGKPAQAAGPPAKRAKRSSSDTPSDDQEELRKAS